MTEENEKRDELSAEDYFERAALVRESRFASSKDRIETAFILAKKAFDANPTDPRYFALLYEICLENGKSLFQAGVTKEQFRQAFSVKEGAEHILGRIDDFFIQFQEIAEKTDKILEMPDPRIVLETLEAIKEIDPKPMILRRLYFIYRSIGRIKEALENFAQAAEIDVCESGPRYLMACFNLHRYDEMIEYFEKHENELRPLLNEEKRKMLAIAFEYQCDKITNEKVYKTKCESEFKRGYSCLQKAEEFYQVNFEESRPEVTGEKYPTPDDLLHTINYGQIFAQQALLIANNQDFGQDLANPIELRQRAIEILENGINRIGDRTRVHVWKVVADNAKLQLVYASGDKNLPSAKLQNAIKIGRELRDDPESRSMRRYDVLPNNLANLIRMECELTGSPLPEKEIEELLMESFRYKWDDPLSYTELIDFYREKNDYVRAQLFQSLFEISFVLRHLIDLDRWQADKEEIITGFHVDPLPLDADGDPEQNLENIRTNYERILKGQIPLREYFEPFRKAIAPYMEKYEGYFKKISPPGTYVIKRDKYFLSIILKMLKEKKETIAEITDLIGFRVLTDTEDQTREVYDRVRELINIGPETKEYLTLDKPNERGYRSLDITGYTKEDDLLIQVQVRPKYIEDEINKTYTHHENYKQISGAKLEDEVRKDPLRYLMLLYVIFARLGSAYNKLKSEKSDLNVHEVIKIYGETVPPEFEQIHQENNSESGEPTNV